MDALNTQISHTVKNNITPIRLQEYAVGIFSELPTKSALKKALKKNRILVNNTLATTATFITGGELIVLLKEEINISKKQLILKLEVIYEDEYLAVINKPAGILVSGNTFKTVTNALEQNLKKSTLEDATTPKPVHRLDYPTTGLLLIGKTTSAIIALNRLFENKQIQKTYIAITIGTMPNKGTLSTMVDNKEAISKYQKINTVASKRFTALNMVHLYPETGRKHQLRVHLSENKNPILGDQKYGIEPLILTKKGLYLHATLLRFIHPLTKENMRIYKEPPNKFKTIFEQK